MSGRSLLLVFILIACPASHLLGQRVSCSEATYQRLMKRARKLTVNGRYELAIKTYTSAKTCKPAYTAQVDQEIADVFERVDGERRRAIRAEQRAIQARDLAEQRRKEAVSNQLAAISSNALYVNKNNSDALQIAKLALDTAFTPTSSQALGEAYYTLFDQGALHQADIQQHQAKINGIRLSSDGRYFSTFSDDQTIKLWDFQGQLVADLLGHTAAVKEVLFSPNSDYLLSCAGDSTARLWNIKGQILHTFKDKGDRMDKAGFSPDGQRILTLSGKGHAKIWDLSGQLQGQLNDFVSDDPGPLFSPDGTHLLTSHYDHSLRLWDAAGNLIIKLAGHQDYIRGAKFSHDGQFILTYAYEETAKLWDINGRLLSNLPHQGKVADVIFSPDGNYILTRSEHYFQDSNTVKLWSGTGAEVLDLNPDGDNINTAIFSPDGNTIFTLAESGFGKLWNLEGDHMATLSTRSPQDAVFSPDGSFLLTQSRDEDLLLWRSNGTLIGDLKKQSSFRFSPNGQYILTTLKDLSAGKVSLWDLNGNLLANLNKHEREVEQALFFAQRPVCPDPFQLFGRAQCKTLGSGSAYACRSWRAPGHCQNCLVSRFGKRSDLWRRRHPEALANNRSIDH